MVLGALHLYGALFGRHRNALTFALGSVPHATTRLNGGDGGSARYAYGEFAVCHGSHLSPLACKCERKRGV